MTYINAEEMCKWYVEDVIKRSDTAMAFKKQCQKYSEELPLESVKKYVKDFYDIERKELGTPEKKTDDNNFKMFQKNIRVNMIIDNFAARPETLAVKDRLIQARENKDDKALNEIIDNLCTAFNEEITANKLEEKVWRNKLVYKATEIAARKIVNEDFKANLAPEKDHGNCTKAITVSLSRAAEKFGLSLYKTNEDKENAAHPIDLAREMNKYIKTSKTGLLKDIENIKIGDIVLLSNSKGLPKHAMMVYGFNEEKTPLLLGFSPVCQNISMYENRREIPREGIVIDTKSFITDKVAEHNRAEKSKMMFAQQKKSQTR